jgi:putative nucleotidyltransferase with HDIG domain
VGFLAMGLLPTMEQWFDRVTGMTLAELRDPRHPLLQELAARAPGTYDHSLQVASLVEAGVSAIGGDAALAYVGALYHDIGKMRKPEYFVENQSGENPHDELRPNISYLIIAGHVKDGLEMAAASGLPKSLREFISSHHGTQVVRWFYVKARDAATEDDEVEEASFRYPGPRPRSKEAAVLMLADACESASRAAGELPSGKIESIVRDLSRERLLDGQFDECKLTLRELHEIEDAIIGRLRSIRHQRLAYPDDVDEAPAPDSGA